MGYRTRSIHACEEGYETVTVTIAGLQLGPASQEREDTVERILRLIDEAADGGARLACLPELALTSYFSLEFSRENEPHFVTADDPDVRRIAARSATHGMALVLPVAEQAGPVPYNTALVYDEGGSLVGKYRKAHLPGSFPTPPDPPISTYERLAFAPGADGFPVFDVAGLRIGIQICYDMNFPEGFRALALQGAQLILFPTNAFAFSCDASTPRRAGDDFVGRTRAYENTVYLLKVNKRGEEHGRTFTSATRLFDPRGGIVATLESAGDAVLLGDVDLTAVIEARRRFPWGRDRRPELYR